MKKINLLPIVFGVAGILLLGFTWQDLRQEEHQPPPVLTTGKPEGCLSCHQEKIQEKAHAREMLGCSSCHLGNPLTVDKRAAHQGLIKNPGDLRVVAKTCGKANCHPHDVNKVKNSLMATNHGLMARLLKVFGEEKILKDHPNLKVEDLYNLKLSSYALDYYRKLCGSCHLFLEKGRLPGFLSEKGGGCSACHLVGNKEEIKKKALHPKLTVKIPLEKCVLCHNRSGRIGFTYQGLYEDEQSGQGEIIFLDGRKLKKIEPDVHHRAGLTCIDCHTRNEVMGNGTFYQKIEEVLEVDCETCHVRGGITKKGNRLPNLIVRGERLYLKGKLTEKLHPLKGPTEACQEKNHRRLICSACHAKYVPQCYGCHVRHDPRETHLDKVEGHETKGLWEEHESYRRLESPPLSRRYDKVVVVTPGCQDFVSFLSEKGELKKYFESITFAQMEPHSTQRKARSCKDCHQNPKVLGLGFGRIIWEGKDFKFYPLETLFGEKKNFRLSQIGDPEGKPLVKFNREGLRPFTKEELKRILKVGVCLSCHQDKDKIYQNWRRDLKCPKMIGLP